jgi:hypothetical protein
MSRRTSGHGARRAARSSVCPVGTIERSPPEPRFNRPYGTKDHPTPPIFPAVNCWATVKRPYGILYSILTNGGFIGVIDVLSELR